MVPQVEWHVGSLPRVALAAIFVVAAQPIDAQVASRRLTTIEGLRAFPGYYHLQSVALRGELGDRDGRILLRSDEQEILVELGDGVRTTAGQVEVRGHLIDLGRLEPDDPRVGALGQGRDDDRWPRPGEELVVRATSVTSAPPVLNLTVSAVALEPWRWEGQMVTVLGNFRGRNLFGDLPGAPGTSRDDFVIRGAEGSIWVTGMRPRGRGFDLDVNRRVDTDQWIEVTGTLVHERGLVRIEATTLAIAERPEVTSAEDEPDVAPLRPPPVEVVFSTPTDGEIDVDAADPVRIQFSRGINPESLTGSVRVSYVGGAGADAPPAFKTTYDGASRAIAITFAAPLEPFRTVRVEILDALKAFDGAPATPWTLVFSVGG